MKIHGLVTFVALCLSGPVLAQNIETISNDGFLPPSPRGSGPLKEEPLPLPEATRSAPPVASTSDLETELKQFRNELREFQTAREEVARSTKSTEVDAERITLQQRQELVDLMTKLATKGARSQRPRSSDSILENDLQSSRGAQAPPPEPPAVPLLSESVMANSSSDIVDPFALGKVLFKAGDFAGAERAFRKAAVESENEMTLKYLLATCVRRQARWKESVSLYKAVAESNQDPVLRDLAKWQLDNIRWTQESESQLEKMRRQRDKQAKSNGSRPAEASAGK